MVIDAREPEVLERAAAKLRQERTLRRLRIERAACHLIEQGAELGRVHRGRDPPFCAKILWLTFADDFR
jgi:hypothetical protein